MNRNDIMKYLSMMNDELQKAGHRGEIVLAGGAVMLLVIKSRAMTKDVDAYFGVQSDQIRKAARAVARKEGLPDDWLNDGVKGFFYGTPPQLQLASFSHLNVYTVTPEYMIAMKAVAGRSGDIDDLKSLVRHVGIKSAEAALEIIEEYVPARLLTSQIQYTVEAIFEDMSTAEPPLSISKKRKQICSIRCQTSTAPVSMCRCSCGGKLHGTRAKKT